MKRPAKTTEELAARVLHVHGVVKVTPSGAKPFNAAVDQDLVRGDFLEPADGAFVVLALHNDHLVRIDDVGALKVGQILLIGVTEPATRTAAEQLVALLDPSERNGFPSANIVDRAAAWRQMRRAGESAGRANNSPARSQEASAGGPSGGAALEAGAGPGTSSNAAASRTPPPPVADEKASVTETSTSKLGVAKEQAAKKSKKDAATRDGMIELDGADVPPPPQAAPRQQMPTTEPGVRVSFGVKPDKAVGVSPPFLGGDLRTCLEASAAEHRVGINAVELRLELKAGVVTRVRFGGALPVSSCAAGLVGRPVAMADGWLVVTAGTSP